jgi:hypothetical protein
MTSSEDYPEEIRCVFEGCAMGILNLYKDTEERESDPDRERGNWFWYCVHPDGRLISEGEASKAGDWAPFQIFASDPLHAYQQLRASIEGRPYNRFNFLIELEETK